MVSLSSLSAFSQFAAAATGRATVSPTLAAARDVAGRAAPSAGLSAAPPPVVPGKPTPRGSLLNLSV